MPWKGITINMKNNEIRFYNVLFPIWLLLLMPTAWVAVLPVNFIVDSLVLIIAAKKMGLWQKGMYKKHILKVWIFGFISDIIGAGAILGAMYLLESNYYIQGDELFLTLPAMILAAVFIFILNYRISFSDLERRERFKLALTLAIITAPYTFLIPISWIYY